MDFLVMWLGGFVAANVTALPPDSQYPTWGLDSDTISATGWKYYKWDNQSSIGFGDPSQDIIRSLDDLLFRAAVAASDWKNLTKLMDPGLSPDQNVMANQTSTRNVYNSDFQWYVAATGVQLLAIIAILPLFWGWWNLQPDLDLSPFDIALAFDAPLLKDASSELGASGVVKRLGDMRVLYGRVSDDEESGHIPRGYHGARKLEGRLGFSRRD